METKQLLTHLIVAAALAATGNATALASRDPEDIPSAPKSNPVGCCSRNLPASTAATARRGTP